MRSQKRAISEACGATRTLLVTVAERGVQASWDASTIGFQGGADGRARLGGRCLSDSWRCQKLGDLGGGGLVLDNEQVSTLVDTQFRTVDRAGQGFAVGPWGDRVLPAGGDHRGTGDAMEAVPDIVGTPCCHLCPATRQVRRIASIRTDHEVHKGSVVRVRG